MNKAPTPPVYPVDYESVHTPARTFAVFDSEELAAIREGNLAILPEDSLDRYLLEGNARPGQLQDEATQDAYRAGICVGLTIHRTRMQTLQKEGVEVPEPVFDPAQGPVFKKSREPWTPRFLRHRVPNWMVRLGGDPVSPYERPAQYFEDGHSIALMGVLHAAWNKRGQEFLGGGKKLKAEARKYISLGVADALAAYASLYGYEPPEDNTTLTYDPQKHFLRRDKQTDYNPERDLKPPRYEAGNFVLGYSSQQNKELWADVDTPMPEVGFQADMKFRFPGRFLVDEATAFMRSDVYWSSYAPAPGLLRGVRVFKSRAAFTRPGEDGEMVEVGERDSHQYYHLGKKDVVIIRGLAHSATDTSATEDLAFGIGYPFYLPGPLQGADGAQGVELLALCREGQTIDLGLATRHPQDSVIRGQAEKLIAQVLAEQQQQKGYSALGRFMLKHVKPHSFYNLSIHTQSFYMILAGIGMAQQMDRLGVLNIDPSKSVPVATFATILGSRGVYQAMTWLKAQRRSRIYTLSDGDRT